MIGAMRNARLLLAITIAYNAGEGVVALIAGLAAGSVALVAFAGDSYLEVAAAGVVLWRLGIRDEERAERAEGSARRFIGWTFMALALFVVYQALSALAQGNSAHESIPGIALALASVTLMPLLAFGKLWTAAGTNTPVLAAEAKETLACSYLSLTLLAGLIANALLGWWWLDAVTALLLLPWLVREGLEGVRGDVCFEDLRACFCRACFYGLRSCPAVCCAPA